MTEKEIGMGKLMGYVEEMQKEGINICRPRFQEDYLLEMMLISKYYGLIKWLVENDKIDIKALVVKGEMRSGWDFDNKKGDEETGEESWNKYYSELCLMLLAIQENPIDFLCSILK